jgi:hypothetical protein
MTTPTPPTDFQSWLDYAIATMDHRGAYLDRIFSEDDIPSQDDIRAAAQEELDHLKQKAAMPWIGMLENWQMALSKKLGRSAKDIVEGNLLATDFSNDSVHVQFEDGSELTFRRAFYVGETPADGAIHRVAVFTEHCGCHEFWIGPSDRISANSEPDDRYKPSDEDLAWDLMAPVGREFGSPDFDRLMDEDAKKFASDLALWIQQCSASNAALHLDEDEVSDALNVQLALRELGQEVTIDAAASVWKHYSQSLMASWMSGAETVQSAARTLYLHCPRNQSDHEPMNGG